MTRLNLFVPDWQSAGADTALYYGTHELREHLSGLCEFREVPVRPDVPVRRENKVIGYRAILEQFDAMRALIDGIAPAELFLAAGTCGMEVVPVTYLNRHYEGDMTLLWFDGHADLNTPQSSPSKTFHGMPLRAILGEGDQAMLSRAYKPLRPEQVVLAGVREFDEAERRYVDDHGMTLVTAADLREHPGDAITEALARAPSIPDGTAAAAPPRNLYVHIDFDVLDAAAFSGVYLPSSGGITPAALAEAVGAAAGAGRVVGASMVELAPGGGGSIGSAGGLAEPPAVVRRLYEALWSAATSTLTAGR